MPLILGTQSKSVEFYVVYGGKINPILGFPGLKMFELSVRCMDDYLIKTGGEKILYHAISAKRECKPDIDLSVIVVQTRHTKRCRQGK